jgi:Rieske Fe-S protein
MSDEHDRGGLPPESVPLEQVSRLDAYLERLSAERPGEGRGLGGDELVASILAAQLRLVRDDVESPSKEFLERLDRDVAAAIAAADRAPRRAHVSRRSFLRGAAAVAGGVGIGVAVGDAIFGSQTSAAPDELVAADRARWYDVAAVDEVPAGAAKAFVAGGVLGYLVNDRGELRAVSAICTHMGCRLTPGSSAGTSSAPELTCLCHGSRFAASGRVLSGHAREPLPQIEVRVVSGRVYALGTRETV